MFKPSPTNILVLVFFVFFVSQTGAHGGVWDRPATCQNGMAWGEECLHGNGAGDSGANEKNQWIEVKTDSATPIEVRYRMSRTP